MPTSPERLNYRHLPVCGSTNSWARDNLASLLNQLPTVISAPGQSAGRGRDGRAWHSPPGQGLYCTMVFRAEPRPGWQLIPLAAGLAVIDSLAAASGADFVLKWPNDVLWQEKKIAGVLCESLVRENEIICLCGIGINLNQAEADFPSDISGRAVSLRLISGRRHQAGELITVLAENFFSLLNRAGWEELVLQRARRAGSALLGREISFNLRGELIQGRFAGLADDGGLLLETPAGRQTFLAGEFELGPGLNI